MSDSLDRATVDFLSKCTEEACDRQDMTLSPGREFKVDLEKADLSQLMKKKLESMGVRNGALTLVDLDVKGGSARFALVPDFHRRGVTLRFEFRW